MQQQLIPENNKPELFIVETNEQTANIIDLPLSKTKRKKIEFKRIQSTLQSEHPALFKNRTMPLAHDIREQILLAYPTFDNGELLRFLRSIFATASYLEAIVINTDKVRYNLDLSATSFISTEQRKTAANYLVGQLNNYHNPKGLTKFTKERRHELFNMLESLDHRFDTHRYSVEHDQYNEFLTIKEQALEKDEKYNLSDSMWPDNY